jgi:hypothetical protein
MASGRWQATWRQFYTGNAAVRKAELLAAGGFDPFFRRAEDVELALRLHDRGLRFIFMPEARGWHYVQRTFPAWLRMPRAYGEADVAMARAGHSWPLTLAAEWYRRRARVTRLLTMALVGRPWAVRAAACILGGAIPIAEKVHLTRMGRAVCGVLYNLCYYDALARSLGGRPAFLRFLRSGTATVSQLTPEERAIERIG